MSLLVKKVPLITNGDGDATATVRLGPCVLRMVRLKVGTLTTPDVTITAEPVGTTLLDVSAVAADTDYTLAGKVQDSTGADVASGPIPDGNGGVTVNAWSSVPVLDRLQVVVAGGGANKTGELTFLYEH